MTSENRSTAPPRRVLTDVELDHILAGIHTASGTEHLLRVTVGRLYAALLSDTRRSAAGFGEAPMDTDQVAIPTGQWEAIVAAATHRGAQWGTGTRLMFALSAVMPAFYSDPAAPMPAPSVAVDYRPAVFRLALGRDACDVIADCVRHVETLAGYFGPGSPVHLRAQTSWSRHLCALLYLGIGAASAIHAAGPLSLVAVTDAVTFTLVFEAEPRHCLAPGCGAAIHDDGTATTACQVAWHQHLPSYPLGAPRPGQWSLHT